MCPFRAEPPNVISPSNRLLFWTGGLLVPSATVAVMSPEAALIGWAGVAVFAFVAIVDALMGAQALDGLTVEAEPIIRVSKDREATVSLTINNPAQKSRGLRLGLPWPRDIDTEEDELLTLLPSKAESSRVHWNFTPRRRGKYHLSRCHLEGRSPFGLWNVRRPTPIESEIRVYPNLLTERKHVAAIFLNRGTFGMHAQRQIGKGRDFEKLREYIPGDGYDEIHWKATAKRGKPVTKVFQIERTQEIYVIVDSSRLTSREVAIPSTDGTTTTLERFITASLILGLAAERQGDLFGLVSFSNQADSFVRAKNGKAHYAHCRDALYTLEPKLVSPDFEEMAAFLRTRLRRRALLVFLTELDDPVLAEQFIKSMDLLSRQHLILVNILQSPKVKPLFEDSNITSMDEIYEHLGGHLRWRELRELDKKLRQRGVTFSTLENERMSAQLVTQYLNVKRRQLI